ncbi:hypothetical protein THRCLA_23345 [Thraustotheca clavata]|uniref:Uncharacterized protein n=1 Tax=Thraustotheca clavata TaxID=74557 RepID=A0A1V9Y760_9STRA|nr:hypothetical protein THRCLA_23345 [Thraustotheca clavata]
MDNQLTKDQVSKGVYVTVTGTPGIGISIFYQYFFSRYRQAYPEATILTASFTEYQQVQKCVVFEPNKAPIKIKRNVEDEYPKAIHLYDGPPNTKTNDSKMVTFSNAHFPLYMPVWELPEMMEAVKLLNLIISIDDLIQRYYLFGGESQTTQDLPR